MHELTIKPVKVQGPFGIEKNYDVVLNGKPIKGSRHDTFTAADAELKAFAKILQPVRGNYGYL
jgi:hypothetical protein